jgi:hypothetical protein
LRDGTRQAWESGGKGKPIHVDVVHPSTAAALCGQWQRAWPLVATVEVVAHWPAEPEKPNLSRTVVHRAWHEESAWHDDAGRHCILFLHLLLLSQNKCNSMTEHANQCECKITKLPIVFYGKDLGIVLSFV